MNLCTLVFSCHFKNKGLNGIKNYCIRKTKTWICLIIIYHSPTSIRRSPMQKAVTANQMVRPWVEFLHLPGPTVSDQARIFYFAYQLFHCGPHKLLHNLSSESSPWLCRICFYFFSAINFEMRSRTYAIRKKWNWFSFAVALFIFADAECFQFLISCLLISGSFLVLVYFIADVSAAKLVRRSFDTVCDACGTPMDLKSIEPADIWSARHATFLMMDPPVYTGCPQHEWRCPLPCCKCWRRRDENTAP